MATITLNYAVLIDENKHTAIKIGEAKKYVFIIPMDSAGLQVVKISHDQYAATWAEFAYDVKKAAEHYLTSDVCKSSTTSSEARGYLEAILSEVTTDASTTPHQPLEGKPTMATAKKTAAKKPAAKKTTTKSATPPAKKPKAAAEGATRGRALSGASFKVADDSGVKRGFLREYVDAAKGLKTFTREQLVSKLKGKEEEERLVRYFGYAVKNGIFAAA